MGLFCGSGMAELAAEAEGYEVTDGWDTKMAARRLFEKNHPMAEAHEGRLWDVGEVLKTLGKDARKVALMLACPPCPPCPRALCPHKHQSVRRTSDRRGQR